MEIPQGAKCELCMMAAEHAEKDEQGVMHYYCAHHVPHHKPSSAKTTEGKHAGHSPNMFRDRFWLSLVLTVPVMLYSEMIQEWLGFMMPEFLGSNYIPLILGTVIFFYGGLVFLKSAIAELKQRQPGMMTLISLAILTAYGYSVATTLLITGTEFFWELATLITVMLLGHWMEMRSVMSAQGALRELAKLLPDEAERIIQNAKIKSETEIVSLSALAINDNVLIRPGNKIPVDGIVVGGQSEVNEAMITGESRLIKKHINSKVIAGTVNGNGSLKVRVTEIGEKTALAGIMRLVAQAQASKSRAQILADKAAFYLTIIAISTGLATFFAWLFLRDDFGFALERTVTVLVIACPHALGLAIPLVTAISTSLGAQNGLLVRQRMALEAARNIDVVLFDKTGTLTRGEHGVVEVIQNAKIKNQNDNSKLKILEIAAAVENHSEHSLARAIVKAAKDKNLEIKNVTGFENLPGKGVQAKLDGVICYVGGPQLLNHLQIQLPPDLQKQAAEFSAQGKTIVYVIQEQEVFGLITLADLIREESKTAINELKALGIKTAMLTGDSQDVAAYVARTLGIDEYFAEVLPEEKINKVKELQGRGLRVAMVGDGVNDAPALTAADIGIAIGAGTDVAIESAGIILMKNDPRDVVKIIKLSRATYKKMTQNLFWASGYNVIAIPLAAGILAGFEILLAPALGAALMSVSTVIVALNAQLLKKTSL